MFLHFASAPWRGQLISIVMCLDFKSFIHPVICLGIAMICSSAVADDNIGFVCLGVNLAKIHSEHTDRLHIQINGSQKAYFDEPLHNVKMIATGLNLEMDHTVKIYFDGKVAQSWELNFNKLRSQGVLIWRSPGAWKMEAIKEDHCVSDT